MIKQIEKAKDSGETLGPKGTKGCVLSSKDLRTALRLISVVCFLGKTMCPDTTIGGA